MNKVQTTHPYWQRHGQLQRGTVAPELPGMVWLLVRGQIDIFVQAVGDGAVQGAREHWFSMAPGHIFISPPATGVLRLAPSNDAEYWAVPRTALAQGWHCDDGRPLWQPLVEQWLLLMRQQHAVDQADIDLAQADGEQVLKYCDGILQAGLAARRQQLDDEAAQELERLARKGDHARQAVAQALGGLATLFDGEAPVHAADGDALLAALQVVGSALGITFRQPAAEPAPGERRHRLRDIADASGVRMRVVALQGRWWEMDNGPLLAYSEDGRPLALLPLRGGGYRMRDPAQGSEQVLTPGLAGTLGNFACMFYRGLPAKMLGMLDVVRFALGPLRTELAAILLVGTFSALLGMAIPIVSGHLFDNVFPAAATGQMVQAVAMLFIASVVTLLFEASRATLMLRVEGRASSDLQAAVWDRVLKLPTPFFRDYSAGDLAMRINGINEIRQALAGSVISSILSGLFSLFNIVVLFYYSARLALVALLLVAIMFGVNAVFAVFNLRLTREASTLNGALAGRVLEYLSGISKLRVTGAEVRAFANWAHGFAQQKRLTLRAGSLANVSNVFGVVFPVLANAAIFACIGWNLAAPQAGRMSTGEFIAFSAVFAMFLNAMLTLVKTATALTNLVPVYERTKPVLQALPEVDESKRDPGRLTGAVELSRVSFAYGPDLPRVLHDVSLSIKPGEFVALVGGSGSGKSTLFRLLLGFEQASQGDIYYDGQNLKDVDAGAVRRQLGVVLQSGRLMSGSIFSNIVGSAPLRHEDAWAAARACGLDKDIEAMPMGMHTVVSDGGGGLSGGQRQRLLIARALARQPAILYFDEATSALDNQTQAVVSRSLQELRVTRVVIAHRLSTIVNADRIYVLEQGRIVQAGTYEELMQQDGLFADMAKRQII
jgi:ATP-binding cassette subfamily C protein